MSKKFKIILTVSIILNVLLLGVLIGMSADDLKDHRRMRGEMHRSIDKLPGDKAKLVKQTMRSLRKDTKKTRRQIRKTRSSINKIITAPDFDESAFDKEIANLQNLTTEMMASFGKVTKELAVQLEQDEREVIAELLKKKKFNHRKNSGDHSHNPPPGLDQPPPF